MNNLKDYKKGYTVPELAKLTGLSMQGARSRLELYTAGKISQEHLTRKAQVTKPRKRS